MERFRQIGEVVGSIQLLMVFRDEIRINQRQCCLLVDAFNLAFQGIAEEIKQHLRFDERITKWKALERPLRELHRIFREGEQYIRQCLEARDWGSKAVSIGLSTDCIEFHLHNLLWCIPVVLEAIESVGEISGRYHDEVMKMKLVFTKKYERDWMEPKLFQHKLGRLYLVSQDMCKKMDTAWKEDKWMLSEMVEPKLVPVSKHEAWVAQLLTSPRGMLFPISALQDYQVRRRIGGSGSNYKEVQWMGESFAAKQFIVGDIEQVKEEISILTSVSHPNVMHCLYAFCDEEKKDCILLMELMWKDLSNCIKERKGIPFSLPVSVDIMLQIARGMEYLHSRKIYHGELNPSNILIKPRSGSSDGYLHVRVSDFGLPPVKNSEVLITEAANGNGKASNNHLANGNGNGKVSSNQGAAANLCIWHAPEVLTDQEQMMESGNSMHTEKADVYSFAMICFELLTGRVPFEDGCLQGDKLSRNIRAGERPLFPLPSHKHLTSLTKRCWHADPAQRPSFSSICRVLRYIKRFLILNPDQNQPDPPVDYFDIDTWLSKQFTSWAGNQIMQVQEIPFQMYAYRIIERERTNLNLKYKSSDSGSEGTSGYGDDIQFNTPVPYDCSSTSLSSTRSSSTQASSDSIKKGSVKKMDGKPSKQTGQNQKAGAAKPPQLALGRNMRIKSESQLQMVLESAERLKKSGHASDSECT